MLIVTLIFGSILGLSAALVSYFALGLGLLGAFALYLACAIVPALISLALAAAQLMLERVTSQELTPTR